MQRLTLTRNFELIDKCNGLWPFVRASSIEVKIYPDIKGSHKPFCFIFKLKCFILD